MTPLKFLFFIFFFPITVFSQHTIKATFSPVKDYTWAILYKTTPTSNNYIAQGKINEGVVLFNLDADAEEGIYKLTFAVPQEEYNFDIIYSAKEDIELTYNEKTGVVFQKSLDNIILNDYLNQMSFLNVQVGQFYIQKKEDKDSLVMLFQEQQRVQSLYEKETENSIVNHFIKANKPYIPSQFEDDTTYINNLTDAYFSNINFNDPVLQRSRFLMDRSIGYIVGVYNEGENKTTAFNKNIDFIEKQLSNTEGNFHKIFLDRLWNKLVLYRLTDNANYLAEKHLIPLAEKMQDPQLVKKLINFKNLSIGNEAPDFEWEENTNGNKYIQKLSKLSVAENYILVFWSSTCSHCLTEIPKLNEFLKPFSNTDYKVIAIGLEDEPSKWNLEIKKYPNFIHVIGLGKWENKIGKAYDVQGTPTYFVLDKEKKFILKPDNLEKLEDYLKNNQNK